MKCFKCKGEVTVENQGGKFFALCHGACAGTSKIGSPLTNGRDSKNEAEREFVAEAAKAQLDKARCF